jgi:hypothetical protein
LSGGPEENRGNFSQDSQPPCQESNPWPWGHDYHSVWLSRCTLGFLGSGGSRETNLCAVGRPDLAGQRARKLLAVASCRNTGTERRTPALYPGDPGILTGVPVEVLHGFPQSLQTSWSSALK